MYDYPHVLGFTGTQDGCTIPQARTLETLLRTLSSAYRELHHGDCIGADEQAGDCALATGYTVYAHPPLDEKKRSLARRFTYEYPAEVYHVRNHRIVDESQILIACPALPGEIVRGGTWATIRYARQTTTPRMLVLPDGKISLDLDGEPQG